MAIFGHSLTKLTDGKYFDFFGLLASGIIFNWVLGYLLGYIWFILKNKRKASRSVAPKNLIPSELNINFQHNSDVFVEDSQESKLDENLFRHLQGSSINQNQKRILMAVIIMVVAILAHPPFQVIAANGAVFNMGYDWLFAPPKRGNIVATVNISMLLIQWVGILVIGGIAFFLATMNTSPKHST